MKEKLSYKEFVIQSNETSKNIDLSNKKQIFYKTLKIEFKDLQIKYLELSCRPYNILKKMGISTIKELILISEEELLAQRGFGEKCLIEIREKLKNFFYSRAIAGTVSSNNKFNYELTNFIDQLLTSTLSPREKRIIEYRFGLWSGFCETLQNVGLKFDLSRERIRQIECIALAKLRCHERVKIVEEYLEIFVSMIISPFIINSGGIASKDEIVGFLNKKYKQKIKYKSGFKFLSVMYFGSSFILKSYLMEIEENVYGLDNPTKILFIKIIEWAKTILKKSKKILSVDKLTNEIAKEYLGQVNKATKEFIRRCLLITNELKRDRKGFLGLKEWMLPSGRISEMIKWALYKIGKPAHFSQITLLMNELFPDHGPFKDHNILNIILRERDIFAYVKQGVYGLCDWGIQNTPFIKDCLIELFKKVNRPLHVDYLKKEVLKVCNCKESSVFMTLSFMKDLFVKYPGNFYGLREWE